MSVRARDFAADQVRADALSPLQLAKRDLAAFKFKLMGTVAADPRLRGAPCLAVIYVMQSFVTIDEKTLKRTPAYASIITLIARGSMKETKAKQARKLLEEQGYIVPTGSKTKEGCIKYRLANPHEERVALHVREATDYLVERAADERRVERRKPQRPQPDVGSQYDPTENERGVTPQPDVGSQYDPNYLGENLSSLGTEGRGPLIRVVTTPSLEKEPLGSEVEVYTLGLPAAVLDIDASEFRVERRIGEMTAAQKETVGLSAGRETRVPFCPPATADEAAEMVLSWLDGHPSRTVLRWFDYLRDRLMAGDFTPAELDDLIRGAA